MDSPTPIQKKPTNLCKLQGCRNPRIGPTSNFCINKPLNWKPKLPHHMKGIMSTIVQMLPHRENYAKCKTSGKTFLPPIPSSLSIDCGAWICKMPSNQSIVHPPCYQGLVPWQSLPMWSTLEKNKQVSWMLIKCAKDTSKDSCWLALPLQHVHLISWSAWT